METILSFAAAINAGLLAAALGVKSIRRKSRAGLFAALFLACAAAAIMLIAADHAGFAPAPDLTAMLEAMLTFIAGPLFLAFAAESLGRRIDGRIFWFSLAAIGIAIAAAANRDSIGLLADRMVFAQMAFTAAAAFLATREIGAANEKRLRNRRFLLFAIAALCLLHGAQLVRTIWPDLAATRNIVPFVGSLGLFALSAAVFFGGRLGLLEHLTVPPAIASEAMRALVARTEAALVGGLIRKPDLTATEAASATGATADELAQAMRAVTGAGFAARLQQLRIEEAQRLLADPKEARTSMEAIGLLAGFGSRSAFYHAFRERIGVSPAAYRKGLGGKPVRDPESGQV